MAQQLDFSEFTFGFALTENFSRSKSLRGVPVFPSLKEEGQKTGGYDVALDDGKGIPDQDDVSIGEMQKRGLTVHEPEGAGWTVVADSLSQSLRGGMVPADIYDLAREERNAYRAGK